MPSRPESRRTPFSEMPDTMPLGEVLFSLKELKEYPIHGQVGTIFRENGDGVTTRFRESIERFLSALIERQPERIVEMLMIVAPVFPDDPDFLKRPVPNPVVGEDDTLIPTDASVAQAWVAAERWFKGTIMYGWVDDERQRPSDLDLAYPRWLFRACLELTRRFLEDDPSSPTDAGAASRFVERLDGSWPGLEVAVPRVPAESVEIQFNLGTLVREPDQPRSVFVQKILGKVANDILWQVNDQATGVEWLREYGWVPHPTRQEVSRGREPSPEAEEDLVRRMFGEGTRKIGGKPDAPDPVSRIQGKTRRVAVQLGFLRPADPVTD